MRDSCFMALEMVHFPSTIYFEDAYEIILKEGLDHRVANLGGAIGAGMHRTIEITQYKGIYFATSSQTSTGYVPNSGRGKAKMLLCRVTLGDVGQGNRVDFLVDEQANRDFEDLQRNQRESFTIPSEMM